MPVVCNCPRSIPAWAGETAQAQPGQVNQEVYPRVGGGNAVVDKLPPDSGGLSPRGRGKRWSSGNPPSPSGSIPAWAGETEDGMALTDGDRVYPRVGGGNW